MWKKGKNAGMHHFLRLPKCFQKATFEVLLKVGIVLFCPLLATLAFAILARALFFVSYKDFISFFIVRVSRWVSAILSQVPIQYRNFR